MQTPLWQVSICVQRFPSLQPVPSALDGLEQAPVAGAQVPTSWHWSWAMHTTGFTPVHTPAWQLSLWVQALPSLHGVPFAFDWLVQAPVGSQVPEV